MAKIMVVDDDDQVRILLQHMLERMGHEVLQATNGLEALQFYREEPSEIIFMDLIMPGKEGIETITEFRHDFPDAVIVAMSGGGRMGPANYLEIASKLGAKRTLTKPFTFTQVENIVQSLTS